MKFSFSFFYYIADGFGARDRIYTNKSYREKLVKNSKLVEAIQY
jgi:hypothetical protein